MYEKEKGSCKGRRNEQVRDRREGKVLIIMNRGKEQERRNREMDLVKKRRKKDRDEKDGHGDIHT